MPNALVRKLSRWGALPANCRDALEELGASSYEVERGEHLIHEGDPPKAVFLLLEGWAFRYTLLPNGKRLIVSLLIPGDLCDLRVAGCKKMHNSIAMLSPGRVVAISREAIIHLVDNYPLSARALRLTSVVDEAVLREWLVNIGGRDAYSRTAHLLCELGVRMDNVGLFENGICEMPLTQGHLGEALGLTPIHINRVLQRLRANNLISLHSNKLMILDYNGLKKAGDFDPDYLYDESVTDKHHRLASALLPRGATLEKATSVKTVGRRSDPASLQNADRTRSAERVRESACL
jgi:CRP-like cAMP-binding protein